MGNKKNLTEKFDMIYSELVDKLFGQDLLIKEVCNYFKENMETEKYGNIFLIGDGETGKKTIIRRIFDALKDQNREEASISEVDLSSYNFNFGDLAFLNDIFDLSKGNSRAILFKNTDKASKEIIDILSKLGSDRKICLNGRYQVKNGALIQAEEGLESSEVEEISCFYIGEKFLIFTSNNSNCDISKNISEEFYLSLDKVFHSKPLTDEEKDQLLEKEVLEAIKVVESKFRIEIMAENADVEEYSKLYSYIMKYYRKDNNFGVSDFVSYIFEKPLTNILDERLDSACREVSVFVEGEYIYARVCGIVYNFKDYSYPTLSEAEYNLNSVIGIQDLKDLMEKVKTNLKVQRIRERLSLPTFDISLNMIFAGNAGTGKTNVARITFEYLNALGVLSKGIFKEVSKADFVTKNLNEVSKRTDDIITSAIGGVLFIDEAYSLCESEDDKMGKEIVDALLKGIEDNRGNIVVILAGYEKDIRRFLSYNQGLESRFPNWIRFEDYTPKEMYKIAINIADSKGYRISDDVKPGLMNLFERNNYSGKNDLGNARFVRNIIENAIMDASKKYLSDSNKEIDLLEKDNFNFKVNTKFNLESKLSELTGLETVKDFLRTEYKLIVAQEKRRSAGIITKVDKNLNMVFVGNPGTGKSTVGNIVAEMLNNSGLLKTGNMVEANISSFTGGTERETLVKTSAKFNEAIGGVLFIDEAYAFFRSERGKIAFNILTDLIRTHLGDIVVIFSGVENKMMEMFEKIEPLGDIFTHWQVFDDYESEELFEMSLTTIKKKGFKLSDSAKEVLQESFSFVVESIGEHFKNGRFVNMYVEDIIRQQSIRIADRDISLYEMNLILGEDVENSGVINIDNEFNLEERLYELNFEEDIKSFVNRQYKFLRVQNKKKKYGLSSEKKILQNMVLVGENGGSKNEALNLLAQMYYSLGLIEYKKTEMIDAADILKSYDSGTSIYTMLYRKLGKMVIVNRAELLIENERATDMLKYVYKFMIENQRRVIIALVDERDITEERMMRYREESHVFPIILDFKHQTQRQLFKSAIYQIKDYGLYLINGTEALLEDTIKTLDADERIGLNSKKLVDVFINMLVRRQSLRIFDTDVSIDEVNLVKSEDIVRVQELIIQMYGNR
ncbi:MAG: AAA family ATPase [Clostridioides sp.]|nr:AAA family ATPase [Clostridioides sp.]